MLMFFRKKDKRVDWPYLVFVPIAFGIILATLVLVLKLINTAGISSHTSDASKFKIETEMRRKKVEEKYQAGLQDLAYQIFQLKEFSEVFSKSEAVFFSIHVPQEHLEQHLQAWLKISALKDGAGNKTELSKIVDQLIEEVKK